MSHDAMPLHLAERRVRAVLVVAGVILSSVFVLGLAGLATRRSRSRERSGR